MGSDVREYLRIDKMPHIWCQGCGHGIVLGAVVRAISSLGLNKDDVVVVSGIGCASRAPGYLDFNTLHTTHGRALAFATGIKLANPRLKVIVLTGDGDCAAIGGNHLIHAARRNIDITTVCFNNSIYGMTSGQYSPMTPLGAYATTAPYGNLERNFDLSRLAAAAGAVYAARATTYHARQLEEYIREALTIRGFTFVEAMTQCPTYYGRKNRIGDAADVMKWFRDNSVPVGAVEKLPPEKVAGKLVIGEIHRAEAPEYTHEYGALVERLKGQEVDRV